MILNTRATPDPYIGTLIASRWRVERPLSAGGMGAVYIASHTETGRRVAVKVIKSEGAMDPEMMARFRRESQSLAAVSHPNIVTFLDSGVDNGTLYLVMELLSGSVLRECMTQPMPWTRALRICGDVLRALAAVHAHGLVHRDLKPENVFLQQSVGHEDFAKLIDFGIVRFAQPRTTASVNTRTGAIIGTPGYISPETLAGRATTQLSDLYAVGVMLYELITGVFPFDGESVQAMLVRQLFETVPTVSTLVPVPKQVDDIVAMLMQRNPAERPQSAMEALSLVSRALGTSTPPPPQLLVEHAQLHGHMAPVSAEAFAEGGVPAGATPVVHPGHSTLSRAAAVAGRNARRVSTTLRNDRKIAASTFLVCAGIAIFARHSFAVDDDEVVASGPSAASAFTPHATNGEANAASAANVASAANGDDDAISMETGELPTSPPVAHASEPVATPRHDVRVVPKKKALAPALAPAPARALRAAPDATELAAFVASHRAELLSCGGDRVPRDVVLHVAPSGAFSASIDARAANDEPARCARTRIAAWSMAPFAGAALSTSTRLAFGTTKPELPSSPTPSSTQKGNP